MNQSRESWYTSKQILKLLKINDCELMHLRLEGKIEYKKEGNRFWYLFTKNH